MRCRVTFAALLTSCALAAGVAAEDAQSVLETMREKQIERFEGVRSYMVDQSMDGHRVQLFFERGEEGAADAGPLFRPTSRAAIAERTAGSTAEAEVSTPELLDAYAAGLEMTGEGLGAEVEQGLADAGLPRGLLAATGSDPWATLDPRLMMGGMASGLRQMSAGMREGGTDPSTDAKAKAEAMETLADSAELVGTETIDGRDAFHIRADGIGHTQEADGTTFTIDAMSMWIDREMYVPLRLKMEGVAISGGESRPMSIEKLDMDYAPVPGSKMYEPRKRVMRIAGVIDAEQQSQMQEAQQQMAEFEEQMKQMPAAQRDMIMRQMGPQMEKMKNLAAGGGFEMVTEVHEIRIIEGEG